jgi:holliday junction DNA helicase RuvA
METPPMIGRLRGQLIAKRPPWVLLDVHGVGYELEVPMSTLYDLPEAGSEIVLLTHYAQKEDTVALYGFLREDERALFRDLQRVSGIGARIALAVLSGVSTAEFARLVQAGDVAALTRVPGIGRKTAERIVVELRDRLATEAGAIRAGTGHAPRDARGEAEAALQQLGYKPAEAQRLARAAAADGDAAETIIRKALRAALGR